MAEINSLGIIFGGNLQGYWRMEDNWNDSSANGYNLTANNSPTFSTGKYGKAGTFASASSQSASIAYSSCPNIIISGSQTWSCWVNQTTTSSYQTLMGISQSGGTDSRGLVSSVDSNQNFYFTLNGLTTNTQATGYNSITTGVWTHVCGVYNTATSTLKLYVNGVEVDSKTASGSPTAITSGTFSLGRRGDAAVFLNGSLDDAAIFNTALTAGEVELLYENGVGGAFVYNLI